VHEKDGGLRARLAILGAAVLFSSGGAAIKATTLTGWQVACLRSAVAAVAVLLMLPAARVGWGVMPVVVGIGYAATMILFVLANKSNVPHSMAVAGQRSKAVKPRKKVRFQVRFRKPGKYPYTCRPKKKQPRMKAKRGEG